jgi:hypothetical protein
MPFVLRNPDGKIIALTAEAAMENQEFLESGHQEIMQFLDVSNEDSHAKQRETLQALKNSDTEIARVIEDIVNLLIDKQVILFTDLPDAVQQKLINRQQLRAKLQPSSASIISEDDPFM